VQGDEKGYLNELHVYQAEMRDRLPDASLMATEFPSYSNDRGNARYTGKGSRLSR
jgi:uncharacterized short protein YbdD (DUF466 family)